MAPTTLPRAGVVAPAGAWPPARETGRLLADWNLRSRRRIRCSTEHGLGFLLDLPGPGLLRDGDGLVLDDGGIVRVVALAEDLLEITTFDDRGLVRIGWHLGNRHLPVQIMRHALRILAEPAAEDLVQRLGGRVAPMRAAFEPEPGATTHV